MASSAIGGMGDLATPFVSTGHGGFDTQNVYTAGADSSFAYDAKTLNTQAAVNSALAFGGGGLPKGMGMMAGILPAALKIEEHKQMRKVAERYYEKYIKDFNRKYGFQPEQIEALVTEFREVTDEIAALIPDEGMRQMYQKYIDSYPTMYLSMIPVEALQTKLAVKCVTENANLRKKIEEMSSCVSSLVRNLTELQITAGIPPIVNLMFESMPDPLTAMTDPMYHKYNDAITTYHKLLQVEDHVPLGENGNAIMRVDGKTPSDLSAAAFLRQEPVHFLKELFKAHSNGYSPPGYDGVSGKELKELMTVMDNMQTQSGCQPFGDEWNHTGPTPAMNPNMCLGEADRFQPGNPRHNEGRTNVYQAKRGPDGQAHWVQSGAIPALSSGGPQMVQHTPQPQGPDQWAGMRHMPGVDPRPNYGQSQQAMQGTPPMQNQAQFNQAFSQQFAAPAAKRSSRSTGRAKTPKKSTTKKGGKTKRSSRRSTATAVI